MAYSIYLDDNNYDIYEFNVEKFINKKTIILNQYFDVDNLLLKIKFYKKNLEGIILFDIDITIDDRFNQFEKFRINNRIITDSFNYVLENYNNQDSIFILKMSRNINDVIKFMNQYVGTFIFIFNDYLYHEILHDDIYKNFNFILLNNSLANGKYFFSDLNGNKKCDLIKKAGEMKIENFFRIFGEFTKIIIDTECENLWFYLDNEFTRKKYIY